MRIKILLVFILITAAASEFVQAMQPQQTPELSAMQQVIAQQLAAMQLLTPEQSQIYKDILVILFSTTKEAAIQAAGEQVKNSIKHLITLYMNHVSKKLTDAQKAILYPILTQLQQALTLVLQYPMAQSAPPQVQAQLQQIHADIAQKVMPFGLIGEQLPDEAKVDDQIIMKTVQAIKDAISASMSSFKPSAVKQIKPAIMLPLN